MTKTKTILFVLLLCTAGRPGSSIGDMVEHSLYQSRLLQYAGVYVVHDTVDVDLLIMGALQRGFISGSERLNVGPEGLLEGLQSLSLPLSLSLSGKGTGTRTRLLYVDEITCSEAVLLRDIKTLSRMIRDAEQYPHVIVLLNSKAFSHHEVIIRHRHIH